MGCMTHANYSRRCWIIAPTNVSWPTIHAARRTLINSVLLIAAAAADRLLWKQSQLGKPPDRPAVSRTKPKMVTDFNWKLLLTTADSKRYRTHHLCAESIKFLINSWNQFLHTLLQFDWIWQLISTLAIWVVLCRTRVEFKVGCQYNLGNVKSSKWQNFTRHTK